jgi:hypothetical protein
LPHKRERGAEQVGYCERPGFRRVGFGDCAGTVLAVRP